jgi:membrane-bound metal-dependent hydrolase YbcI (DUF457 family)
MLSAIPDVDLMIPFLEHRGPTHSIAMAFAIFIPIFTIFGRKAAPYLVALIQHAAVGDYMAGSRIQLLWPLTTGYYGMEIGIKSQTNMTIEWIMFLASMVIMFKTKDNSKLFHPHHTNLILTIPTFTVLLPTFLSFPVDVPIWLMPPHLVYIFVFSMSIIIDVFEVIRSV